MSMFYQQSWVLTHFLHHYGDGKYLKKFEKYYELYLLRGTGRSEAARQFRNVFGFHEDEDFIEFQKEYEDYLKKFLTMDLSKYSYTPPARDDWGPEGPPSRKGPG